MSKELEENLYKVADTQSAFNSQMTADLTVTIEQLTATLDLSDEYRQYLEDRSGQIAKALADEIEKAVQAAFKALIGEITGFTNMVQDRSALTARDLEKYRGLFAAPAGARSHPEPGSLASALRNTGAALAGIQRRSR